MSAAVPGPAVARPLHVLVAGPIAGDDLRPWLDAGAEPARGYLGAPLTAILIGELLRQGHRVTALTTDPGLPLAGGPQVSEGPGLRFVACPARPRAWRCNGRLPGRALDGFAFERRALTQVIADAAPDLVHAHWSYEFALAALALPSLPVLITCHDSPAVVLRFTRSPYRALRYLMARRVFRRGRHFTAVSDYLARSLAPLLPAPPAIVPNPVAPYVFEAGRVRPTPGGCRVAMVCNGWDRRKNPEPALRAFAAWRRRRPAAELHLYGADFGPGERAAQWAQAQGLAAGLQFHGRRPHRELVAELAHSDLLLHPALEESFGVVLAEALALGLPVVAGRDSGAVPWVVGAAADGASDCALLVDVRDPAPIEAALERALDADYGRRSACGLQRAQAFAPAQVADAYVRQYRALLDLAPQRRGDAAAAGLVRG